RGRYLCRRTGQAQGGPAGPTGAWPVPRAGEGSRGCLGGRGGVIGGERGGGAHPERGVRPSGVVVLAPVADHHARFGQAGELLAVQELVADAAVERLDVGVLPRRARVDVASRDGREATPIPERVRGQLGAVVAADVRRGAALGGQALEHRDGLIGGDAAVDVHRQRLAGVLVDDVEQPQRAAVGGLVVLEVKRPHVIRALADIQTVAQHRDRLAPAGWAHQFPFATSLSACFSSAWSATIAFKRAFSRSSSLSRLASSAFIPPYWLRQR